MRQHLPEIRFQHRLLPIFMIGAFVIGFGILLSKFFIQNGQDDDQNYVNVYNWYGVIPLDVLKDFEKETGIKVRYDLFDNNEVVEAKLFAGNSGYDVIFPSASPYIYRHIKARIYEKLDKDLLPNLAYRDPEINEKMRFSDPDLAYAVPYYWGTFGFLYVEEEVKKRLPNAPVNSYRMLFDPEVVSKFADCGVTLLDEPVDVYPLMLTYLERDPYSDTKSDLNLAQKNLSKIRKYIKRFSSLRFINEIVAGDSCVAQAWSGDAQTAQEKARDVGRNVTIRYVVPDEGGILWIDAMVIPKGAPHRKNAHKFINFLLDPKISARVSNYALVAVANREALAFVNESIRDDPTIYPRGEKLKKLKLDKPQSTQYERLRTEYWGQFKAGKKRG